MPSYRVQLNPLDVNDSRALAVARVPARSCVLDVGIGDGTVGDVLRRMGCKVCGVEYDKQLAEQSRDKYERLIEGDVESLDLVDSFTGQRFDVVLMLDVLEHLRDPTSVLERVPEILDDGGFVIISLPNITHAAIKLQLLSGHFRYTEEGLLDATHLRFFDYQGVSDLLASAHFTMFDLARVVRAPDQTEIPVRLQTLEPPVLNEIISAPESTTYQFVLCAAPSNSPILSDPPITQAALLQHELTRLLTSHAEVLARRTDDRPWLNPSTLAWIEATVDRLRDSEIENHRAIQELVGQFVETLSDIRARFEALTHPLS